MQSPPPKARVRPFLKWAGGKRQLLPQLRRHYPPRFDRYIEPFLGSGAVFFDLFDRGALRGRSAWLTDVNPDLIGCYVALRDQTEKVIAALAALEREHRASGEACYYEVRNERFNPLRSQGLASHSPELAAMLIYLNRTGFNGLFRLNRRGEFNVPAGRYDNPTICDAAHLRLVAAALQAPGTRLEHVSFERVLGDAGPGDFVYCDPPYAPLTRTANFANYTAGGFTAADQTRLQQAVIDAAKRGARVALSNSSAGEIEAVYSSVAARAAGLVARRVAARRAINSRADARGPVSELIVTNVIPRALDEVRPRMARARDRGTRRSA